MDCYSLVIYKVMPSGNTYNGGKSFRWLKKRWGNLVKGAILDAGLPSGMGRIHLVIRYYFTRKCKKRSPENYPPKLLLDSFITSNIVIDDNPSYITYIMPFSDPSTFGFIDKSNPRVEIDVYPAMGKALSYGYILNDAGQPVAYGYHLSLEGQIE